ncbi:ATP-binding cassette domain-containing protein [Arthrobacter sp. APC 3897]|uniref:ABC transporter ATP-binding protein n=1 Tax=Arthrobacter sp. APC 3897 TaxID=3035204 RepID=UPI0025B60D02|nr:ATP-binding cassette domain-containing protein [Arthrobacter sp. APC 3897]MDN3482872.1 ATP-binding cassette domain-containing protein [Arthrobacter sp. APC 3897]
MAELVVADVHFSYPESSTEILSGGTVHLSAGRPWLLTGPNGVGKSTWLKTVAGLLPLSRGTITHDGIRLQRGQILYADPIPSLFDELSALEHMELIAEMWMMNAEESEKYISDVTDTLEILQMVDIYCRVENYSSGMREKLALCLILLRDASVVLLDEPLTATDASSRDILLKLISDRAVQNIVVVVSHISEVALSFNAQRLHLTDGVVHEA